ncbi:MAG: ABC transporter permease [Solidesulfovibrio sp.]|uniref:ABC transporter permease n=1 Tax=Solidesulfovibrio sp. TaxID=2910990 RepID=UPI002B1F62C5|nr:ABC transporter permease [Solidesulfovibrio sp.]MEA4857127.1 ABC transporter permease [Solidesulfovibrio sp.]
MTVSALGPAILVLLLWQGLCQTGLVSPALFASPAAVALALVELWGRGMPPGRALPGHVWYSLARVLAGTGLAVVLGVPLGLALGGSPRFRALCMPLVDFLRPIPPLAWIPLAILWFGLGMASAAYLIFLGAFFPVVLATCSGVLAVDPLYVDAVRVLGGGRAAVWRKVLLPGALPSVVTGVRVGLGIGWMTLVAAEFIGVRGGYGLGYMIMSARDLQRTDMVMAGMAVIGLIGLGMEWCMQRLSKTLLRWQ